MMYTRDTSRSAGEEYSRLYKERRWLQPHGDTVDNIGGRSWDMTQLVSSIVHRVKEIYPMNGVPVQLIQMLDEGTAIATEFEHRMNDILVAITDDVKNKKAF